MTDARDELASLVLEAIRANVDAYVRPLPDDEYYSEDLSSAIIDSHGIDLRAVADAILAAGWHKAHPICAPDKHVMYEHCGMCGESPEAVKEDLALLRTALARIERDNGERIGLDEFAKEMVHPATLGDDDD